MPEEDRARETTPRADTKDPGTPEVALALDGGAGCIAQARAAAAAFLAEVREQRRTPVSQRAVQDTQLIVSELVTNAVKYAPGPVLLNLRIIEDTVEVEVWDSQPHAPAVHSPDPQRIGQHGLEIVAVLARTLTIRSTVVGKRVSATLDLDPAERTP
ncbi:ATP-binding protein [Streptomyces sp. NPDC088785]|uniref:ATP-binding protein n=1 Tax=Streptomyces sp. NPDC088785 TaxID=3365897 RepID=UPI00380C11EC